jgi:hypothetical protein
LEECVTKEANSSIVANETFGRELLKLFLESPKNVKTRIPLNPPLTIVAPIMNLSPIMAVLPANALLI